MIFPSLFDRYLVASDRLLGMVYVWLSVWVFMLSVWVWMCEYQCGCVGHVGVWVLLFRLWMWVSVVLCVCVCVWVCVVESLCVCESIRLSVCMVESVWVSLCVCVSVCMCEHLSVCVVVALADSVCGYGLYLLVCPTDFKGLVSLRGSFQTGWWPGQSDKVEFLIRVLWTYNFL